MSNWPYKSRPVGQSLNSLPPLNTQERFEEGDLEQIARLYRRAGVPRPPDPEVLRWLIAESNLAIALREGGPRGPLRAFARVLTDFSRVAVVVEAIADGQGRRRDSLRAHVISAALSHPLLAEVGILQVLSGRESPRDPVEELAFRVVR